MNEASKRSFRCCFTGHRPEKLGLSEETVGVCLEREIRRAVEDGYSVFISGMARGTDIIAAEIVIRLKVREKLPIKLIAACPYNGFESHWEPQWQRRYKTIINNADLICYICSGYEKNCFHIRNRWMVDHATRVIAVFNGTKGGTYNTIDYAKKQGVVVKNVLQ